VGRPELAEVSLNFALERQDDLHKYYNGTTGETIEAVPADRNRVGLPEYNCLVRLAVRLGNEEALETYLEPAQTTWDELLQRDEISLYDLGDTLLALYYVSNR
jgi:hypothetical protein